MGDRYSLNPDLVESYVANPFFQSFIFVDKSKTNGETGSFNKRREWLVWFDTEWLRTANGFVPHGCS